MWLNEMFIDSPIDFEKRCKRRITLGFVLAALGLAAVIIVMLVDRLPILYLEAGGSDFMEGFYVGAGGGLLGAGLVTAIKNMRYLKVPELKKRQEIIETDERNRMLGLRCWAYAGYSFFLVLYVGMLFAGLISKTVLSVLLVVGAVFAALLFIFKLVLQKAM
ncbi:MAG: hypothetical protein KHZ58_19165 [Hungatella hathewayi]|nr:hypothetical protein [Hungatella hathewayi]